MRTMTSPTYGLLIPHLDSTCVVAQRSGQELPQVESFSPAGCSVDGGEELLILGSNISAQSRVVFVEKGPGEIR